MPRIVKDIRWGLSYSMPFTGVFALMALAGRALLGSQFSPLSIGALLIIYLILGLAIGLLIGGFRPLTRSKSGSGVLGGIVGAILTILVHIAVRGMGNWILPKDVGMGVIFVSIGAVCGVATRNGRLRAEECLR